MLRHAQPKQVLIRTHKAWITSLSFDDAAGGYRGVSTVKLQLSSSCRTLRLIVIKQHANAHASTPHRSASKSHR